MSDQEAPIERFVFSVEAAQTAKKDIDLRITAEEERIEKLVRRIEIGGMPILLQILSITHDKEQLELLGKALIRASEIMPKLDDLKTKRAMLDVASSNVGWLAGTVGDLSDFTEDVDSVTWEDLSGIK